MKTAVAITLIVVGALLVVTPAIADVLYQRNIVTLMEKSGVTSVRLDGEMGDVSRFGLWLTGTGMIGVSVLSSLFGRKESDVGQHPL